MTAPTDRRRWCRAGARSTRPGRVRGTAPTPAYPVVPRVRTPGATASSRSIRRCPLHVAEVDQAVTILVLGRAAGTRRAPPARARQCRRPVPAERTAFHSLRRWRTSAKSHGSRPARRCRRRRAALELRDRPGPERVDRAAGAAAGPAVLELRRDPLRPHPVHRGVADEVCAVVGLCGRTPSATGALPVLRIGQLAHLADRSPPGQPFERGQQRGLPAGPVAERGEDLLVRVERLVRDLDVAQ